MKNVCMSRLILTFILVASLMVSTIMAASGAAEFCDTKCGVRCSKAGRQDRCLKYCGICCEECDCVPSGTSGNKDECPCYRDKISSKGTPKCP